MCGRFFRDVSWATLREWYDLFAVAAPNLEPRYNITPTQDVLIIGKARDPQGGYRNEIRMAHWGLVPSWAKDASLAGRMINARGETVAEKPAYRAAFKRRRCLVPADGFYEWQKTETGKQPWVIRHKGGHPMTFAGLWEENEELDLRSVTIVTIAANDFMKPLHHRMPVLLGPDDYDLWMSYDSDMADVQALIHPYEGDDLEVYPVSRQVNKPVNDDRSNLDAIDLDNEAATGDDGD